MMLLYVSVRLCLHIIVLEFSVCMYCMYIMMCILD